jgi:YHS domain-containing protein
MVGEICTKPAITASPETTVREAAHRMRSRKVGALVSVFEVMTTSRNEEGTLLDPICQMRVDPATMVAQLTRAGRTYYFCAPQCARTFATWVEGSKTSPT